MIPVLTATPQVVNPAVYEGRLFVTGSNVPEDAVLIARVGDYESQPATIEGDNYSLLIVHPTDPSAVGQLIEFYLNGFRSDSVDSFESGKFAANFVLVFVGFPTPTPSPTPTAPVYDSDIRCIYDANGEGDTGRDEAIAAVTDYLLQREVTALGRPPDRQEAVQVVTSYLLQQAFTCAQ